MSTSITGQGLNVCIPPDDELSLTSKKAVQNKVITEELTDQSNAIIQNTDVTWENGWINTTTGEPSAAISNRVRSNKFLIRKGHVLTIEPNGMYWNFGKYTFNGSFSMYNGSWKTTQDKQEFTFTEDLYIIVGLRKSNDANLTPSDVTATVKYEAVVTDLLEEEMNEADAELDAKIDSEISTVETSIQALDETLTEITEIAVGNNICDPDKFESGYIAYTTGNVGSNPNYKHTDYLPITNGLTYALYGFSANYLSKYKQDKSYLTTSNIAVITALNATTVNGWVVFTANWTGYLRLTMSASYTDTPMVIVAEDGWASQHSTSTYIPFSSASSLLPKGVTDLRKDVDSLQDNSEIHAYLPSDIYCAVGRTIELYNNQVCLEAEKYHIRWNCTIGKALERKFSIEGTNDLIGTYTLTFTVYNDAMDALWTASTTLHIIAALSLDTTYSICPIGDSLTNQKRWTPEVISLSDNKLSFVGTFSANTQDSEGNWIAYYHEGRSGFSSTQYINGAAYGDIETPHNKFWDGEKFSWEYYKETYSVNPDAVMIWLGVNGLALDNTNSANNIMAMVASIRDDDSTIPIYLCNTMYRGDQNGLGVQQSVDGYASNKGQWNYQERRKVYNLMTLLDSLVADAEDSNIHLINLALCFDSEYNYGATEMPVNPRASQKELMPTEATHPQPQGYFQIADIMFSVFSAFIS